MAWTRSSKKDTGGGIPSGTSVDPWEISGDIPRYNMNFRYSFYEIYDGELLPTIEFWINSQSGYEGFSVPIPESYGLISGKTYRLSFTLKMSDGTGYNNSYPFGIKHLTTQVATPTTSSTFNQTPTTWFARNNNEQLITLNFTAGENNYLFVTLSDVSYVGVNPHRLKGIKIEEITA